MSIPSSPIYLKVAQNSVAGEEKPREEIHHNNKLPKIPKSVMKRMEKAEISEKEYLTMLAYAHWLPSGKRKLKLNYPELRQMLVATDLEQAPLTQTSGLNKGGMIAVKGQKVLKEMTQQEHLTLLNKNRLKNNPVYTSFRNNFVV